MVNSSLVFSPQHERTIRYLKNEVTAIKNRMTSGGGGGGAGGSYEPPLGNPAGDGYLLQSTAAGVRSWLDSATYSLAGHNHAGVYDPAGTAAAAVGAHEGAYVHADIALNTGARTAIMANQNANYIFAGPAAAPAAAPTFRAMVEADLGTTLSPTFATVKCTALSDGIVPYHVSDAAGLADSPLRSTAADMGMGCAPATGTRLTVQATSDCEATLGAEMLTNSDFATNDFTGWTAGANWAAGTGAAVHTDGSAETLVQSVALTNGIYYQVSFVVVRSAGSVTVTFGDLEGSYTYTTAGTKTVSFTATATAAKDLTFTPSSDFAGSIDSVSVKAITANATPALDIKSSAGTSMAPIRASATLYNLGVGIGCLANNTTGNYNVASGYLALYANTTGAGNVASGYLALCANTTGAGNVASGYAALRYNTTGTGNVASGYLALYANTTGTGNVASGYLALYANTTGAGNVASGYAALRYNTTGNYNVASGYLALYANTTGAGNVASGYYALYANTTGNYNVASGYAALYANTTGAGNVASGYLALYANTEGQYNVALGYYAGRYKAATTSDKLFIDDRDRTNESGEQTLGLIYGGFAAATASQFLRINANLGIKTHTFGTSADGVFAIATGTAPSTSPADAFQLYSADQAAGNACPHFRTESGDIIRLYKYVDADFANVPNSGDADTDDLIDKMRDALISHGLIASA